MKPESEFHPVDDVEWKPVLKGIRKGKAWEKILSWDPETGGHSRLYSLEPGCETEGVITHEFWEEVYILQGGLVDRGNGNAPYPAGTYACRPPGMKHGPYDAPIGCMTFEVRYFTDVETAKRRKKKG